MRAGGIGGSGAVTERAFDPHRPLQIPKFLKSINDPGQLGTVMHLLASAGVFEYPPVSPRVTARPRYSASCSFGVGRDCGPPNFHALYISGCLISKMPAI